MDLEKLKVLIDIDDDSELEQDDRELVRKIASKQVLGYIQAFKSLPDKDTAFVLYNKQKGCIEDPCYTRWFDVDSINNTIFCTVYWRND